MSATIARNWSLLGILALLLVGLRFAVSGWVPSPFIITDELVYTKLARSLVEHGATSFREQPLNFPSVLYPLLLAPAQTVMDPGLAFRLTQLTNAVLVTSALVPLYLLARRWLTKGLSLGYSLVALLSPYTLYSNVAMSENVFFPLVLWVAYLSVRAFSDERRRWSLALAVAMGLAFFAKPHGMLLPLVVAGTFLVSEGLRYRQAPGPLNRLGRYLPSLALYAAFVLVHLLRMKALTGSESLFSAAAIFGSYAAGLGSQRPFDLLAFLRAIAGNLGALSISTAFVPVALFGAFVAHSARKGGHSERVFAAFTLLLAGLLFVVTARHTVTLDDPMRVHERYCFHVAPLVLLGGCYAASRLRTRHWPLLVASGLIALGSLSFVPQVARTAFVADSPSFTPFSGFGEVVGLKVSLPIAAILVLAFVALLTVQVRARRWQGILILTMGYVVGLSSLTTYAHHRSSQFHAERGRVAQWVQHLAKGRPVALLSDGHTFRDMLLVEFYSRQPVRLYYFGPAPLQGINDRPVAQNAAGVLEAISALPDGTVLVGPRDQRLAQPVVGRFESLIAYEKRGEVRRSDVLEGIAGDFWTAGSSRIVSPPDDPDLLQGLLELLVDTSNLPARLDPMPITIRDETGLETVHTVPINRIQTLRVPIKRIPGQPFRVTLTSPTWVPAQENRGLDRRHLGFMLKGVAVLSE